MNLLIWDTAEFRVWGKGVVGGILVAASRLMYNGVVVTEISLRYVIMVISSDTQIRRTVYHVVFCWLTRDVKFPTINITVPHGRDHLAMKTTKAFDYVYTHHRDEADWFLKVTTTRRVQTHMAPHRIITNIVVTVVDKIPLLLLLVVLLLLFLYNVL